MNERPFIDTPQGRIRLTQLQVQVLEDVQMHFPDSVVVPDSSRRTALSLCGHGLLKELEDGSFVAV